MYNNEETMTHNIIQKGEDKKSGGEKTEGWKYKCS
jgi:hypothetical protein